MHRLRTQLLVPALFTLALPTFLACSSSDSEPKDASDTEPTGSEMTGDGDDTVGGLVGGQSGNEGSALRPPCFYPEQMIATVEVTSAEGCFVGEILSLESDGAENSDLIEGDSLGGMMSLFYTSTPPQEGDVVAVQYHRGNQDGLGCPEYVTCTAENCSDFDLETEPEAYDACDTACLLDNRELCDARADETQLGGSVQISTMNGEKVVIEWLGGTYEYSIDELLSDECEAMFAALPNLIEEDTSGIDPDDAAPPPPEPPLSCP